MSETNGNPSETDPVERKIAFIIDQQANFFADVEEVKARHARTDARLDRAIRLGVIEARRDRLRRRALAEKIDALIDAQIRGEAETVALKETLREIAQKAKAETVLLKEALREMTQAVTQTNRRIDELSSNGNGELRQ